jgi:putative SbcD/Mre11-related phosphoesterase
VSAASPCLEHEGWLLTPEGAAVRPEESTAVIADVHLGYEWARGSAGDCVPAHSLAETIERLGRLLGRAEIRRLVVAGDLVESHRPCPRTAADIFRLNDWLSARGVELVVVPGNHDRSLPWMCGLRPESAALGPVVTTSELAVADWTVCHGHRPARGGRVAMGHHHPALGVGRFLAPCFLAGPRLLVLPAFSPNAAGRDVASARVPTEWKVHDLRCVAGVGSELLDFGPLRTLGDRIQGRSRKTELIP